MTTKTKTTALSTQSFVTVETLQEKFSYANKQLPNLEKTSLELKVETEEQLTIANNNASATQALLKEVDGIRVILKAPYLNTVNTIDSYCKLITVALERIKLRFTSQITDYKVIQEAKLKAERDTKLKELQVLEAEKQEESAKISRIETQLVARIFGGSYKKKDGTSTTVSGCVKTTECDELLSWININAPSPTAFKHFQGMYEDMIISVKNKLAAHKINLIDLEKEDQPIAKQGAMRRINESRTEAAADIEQTINITQKIIAKEIKSEVKSIDNEVKEAGKGVRETLSFSITEESLVPRDMLSIDPVKINSYINANKEKIREALTRNEEIIPGIRFFVENKFIAR